MADPVITDVDLGSVVLDGGSFADELLTFAGAGTVVAGTILARDTASTKLVPFVVGGSGGEEIPKAVLTYDVTATGAGDESIRAMVAGRVKKERLVIDADGDDSNIGPAVKDQLRDYGGIIALTVEQLAQLDNS